MSGGLGVDPDCCKERIYDCSEFERFYYNFDEINNYQKYLVSDIENYISPVNPYTLLLNLLY